MKEIVIDFDNDIVYFNTPGQKGTEIASPVIDRIKVIDAVTDDVRIREKMCRCSIFGMNFEEDTLSIYAPVTWDMSNGSLYPVHLLKKRESIIIPSMADKYRSVIEAMGYKEESMKDLSDIVDYLINHAE